MSLAALMTPLTLSWSASRRCRSGRRNCPRSWAGWTLAWVGLAGCGATRAPAAEDSGTACFEECAVEVQNNTLGPIEVLYHEGLSRRSLGTIEGGASEIYTLAAGAEVRRLEARPSPGIALRGRQISCQRVPGSGWVRTRLICDWRRGR